MKSEPGSPSSAPIRVLQLASTSDMGGAERMILWLVEALDRARFTPYVGALIGGGELIERARESGVSAAPFGFRGYFDPAGIRRLIRFIRDNRIDLVQTHGLRADAVARWAARLGGARAVVSTIHSIDPWRRLHHSLLDRATSPLVSRFVAVCQAAKEATVRREGIDPARIDVVPIGLPSRAIPRDRRDEIRRELNVDPDAMPVIGILANLREMKGHRDVIEALPAILRELPDTVFLFAGRDDSQGEIERLARARGVDQAIRFLGYYRDTLRLLAAMDLFLLPSTWEGLPVSILEALHAGVPVIATRVGGIPEIIRDGQEGLLIEPRRPDQIAEAVIRLARNWALRAELSRAADVRAQTMFSMASMTARMEDIYMRALNR